MHPSQPVSKPWVNAARKVGLPTFVMGLLSTVVGCGDIIQLDDVTVGLPDGVNADKFKGLVVHDGGRVTLEDGAVPDDWGAYLGLDGGIASVVGLTGNGIGAACAPEEGEECRNGLRCEDNVCVVAGDSPLGEFCVVSAECSGGQCVQSTCVPAGLSQLDEACLGSDDCALGLRCGTVGIKPVCIPDGALDVGATCDHVNSCRAGLACVVVDEKYSCQPTGVTDLTSGAWQGVKCESEQDQEGELQAYFELPEAIEQNGTDYFRLPFPNVLRTEGEGALNLSGFPTPGLNPLVGVDPVEPYVARVNGQIGWSPSSAVQFRFSGEIDFGSLGVPGAIQWLDITDPATPIPGSMGYRFNPGRTNYICANGLSLRRSDIDPMLPGHTYAVWLSTAVAGLTGSPVARSPVLAALLGESVPTEPALAAAYDKYASFREYLSQNEIPSEQVLNATVFTIAEPAKVMDALAVTVAAEPVATSSSWVKCDLGVVSPCPQAEEARGCESNALFDEYHLLINLPIFQQGEPPYEHVGGDVQSTPVRYEPVCASLTVPKGQASEPFPLVIFTHGTGGSFRSHIHSGVPQTLTNVNVAGQTVHFAVLGFDQVQHGPRRGSSTESPDNLFFNFLNPDASRGNPIQGALDLLAVTRFAQSLTRDNSPIDVDPSRIAVFGHSQGSTHASIALPYIPGLTAAVLSGNGVSLMHALLTKTQPVDIAQLVPQLINDGLRIDPVTRTLIGQLPGGAHHPVLSIIQRHIDPADGVNFARSLTAPDAVYPKHIFQTFGLNDHFSPPETLRIFAGVAHLAVARAHESALPPFDLGPEWATFPVNQTLEMGTSMFTAAVRQYGPAVDADGHFVAFQVPDATLDVQQFLAQTALGLVPSVGR